MISIRYPQHDFEYPKNENISMLPRLICAVLPEARKHMTGDQNESIKNLTAIMPELKNIASSEWNKADFNPVGILSEQNDMIPVTLIADILSDYIPEQLTFTARLAWGHAPTCDKLLGKDYHKTINAKWFMKMLVKHGHPSIAVNISHLIARIGSMNRYENNTAEPRVTDEAFCSALCSYYSSFDPRFSALFYPNLYDAYASKDDTLFGSASALANKSYELSIKNMTANSAYIGMMLGTGGMFDDELGNGALNKNEHIPSLLYQFYKNVGHRQAMHVDTQHELSSSTNKMFSQDENQSLIELADEYFLSELPCSYFQNDITVQQPLSDIAISSLPANGPVTTMGLVLELLMCQSCAPIEKIVHDWMFFSNKALELSAQKHERFLLITPLAVQVSDDAIEWLLDNVPSNIGNIDLIKTTIALSAYCKTLETIAKKNIIPASVEITLDDLAIASRVTEAFPEPSLHMIDDENIENKANIITNNIKIRNFNIPDYCRLFILANASSRKSNIVEFDDLYALVNDEDNENEEKLLGSLNTSNSKMMDAPVSSTACDILAMTSVIYNMLVLDIATVTQDEVNILYKTALSLVIRKKIFAPGKELFDKTRMWLSLASVPSFDTREIQVKWDKETKQLVEPTYNTGNTSEEKAMNDQQTQHTPRHAKGTTRKTIDKYCNDMIEMAERNEIGLGIVGRDEEIRLVETILSRRDKSNPLLLGPAGCGKTAIVEAIAHRIANDESSTLHGYGLVSLDLSSLYGEVGPVGLPEKLEAIMEEAIATKTILFIDEIHLMVSAGTGEVNAANIMKPYLARNGLKVIGATTEREYNYTLAKDRAIARRFASIHLPTLSYDMILDVLTKKSEMYGKYHDVKISPTLSQTIALLAEDYMTDRESPDRELDILDTAAALAKGYGNKTVQENHIVEAVKLLTSNHSIKTRKEIANEIAQNELTHEELDKMFPRVVGQYEAKEIVARRIMESKLGLTASEHPRNVLLFAGPSGVGKTFMASEIAELLDATSKDVLKLSMSEYTSEISTSQLLGGSPMYVGYREGGVLTNFVKAHPNGVVIFDEIDKCSQRIMQMFLGVFDTGFLRAGDGSLCDCHSITFVCTTNIGAKKRTVLGFTNESEQDSKKLDHEALLGELKERFGEPFVNRFDTIVKFDSLDTEDLVNICGLSYSELADKIRRRYNVNLEDTYSREEILDKARDAVNGKDNTADNARTAWKTIEKELMSSALRLISGSEEENGE